jgi:hypothetical protein
MRALDHGDVIVHTHMGKTAGSLFFNLFVETFGDFSCLQLNGDRNHWDDLITMSMSGSLRVVSGHFAYGYHKALGIQNPFYFCILRHPVQRVFSEYMFVRQTLAHPWHHDVITMDIEDYIFWQGCQHSHQHYLFTHFDDEKPTIDDLIHRLTNDYGLFLLYEYLESSEKIIQSVLGLNYNSQKKVNETHYTSDLRPETALKIQEAECLDYELYKRLEEIYAKYLQTGPKKRSFKSRFFGNRLPYEAFVMTFLSDYLSLFLWVS